MAPWHVGRIVVGDDAEGFDWQATGWRYKQYAHGTEPDASQPGFDDSSWSVGQAPFGAAVGYQGDPFHGNLPYARTFWALNTTLWARRTVKGNGTFQVQVKYDNEVWVYWNGSLIFTGSTSIGDSPVFTMTSSGASGVLACKVKDTGVANYFDGKAVLL